MQDRLNVPLSHVPLSHVPLSPPCLTTTYMVFKKLPKYFQIIAGFSNFIHLIFLLLYNEISKLMLKNKQNSNGGNGGIEGV